MQKVNNIDGLLRLDDNVIPDSNEIRLFAKVRNEAKRIPFFFSYYRALGVNRFFIIDNGSTDDTLEILSGIQDCHRFFTTEKMSNARAGMDWIQPLLNQYGRNRWCVVADADELLVYPNSERVPLPTFCEVLDRQHADALPCIMLDMYPDGNIDDVNYISGQSFVEACPFFDRSGYHWFATKYNLSGVPLITGGPRTRIFYPELVDHRLFGRISRRIRHHCGMLIPKLRLPRPIALNKIPLVRWNERMSFGAAAHDISFANVAKSSGALLHFKFLSNFDVQVKEELTRKAYFKGGEEYQRYAEWLQTGRPVNFKCDISVRFTGSRQLLELGLIK